MFSVSEQSVLARVLLKVKINTSINYIRTVIQRRAVAIRLYELLKYFFVALLIAWSVTWPNDSWVACFTRLSSIESLSLYFSCRPDQLNLIWNSGTIRRRHMRRTSASGVSPPHCRNRRLCRTECGDRVIRLSFEHWGNDPGVWFIITNNGNKHRHSNWIPQWRSQDFALGGYVSTDLETSIWFMKCYKITVVL